MIIHQSFWHTLNWKQYQENIFNVFINICLFWIWYQQQVSNRLGQGQQSIGEVVECSILQLSSSLKSLVRQSIGPVCFVWHAAVPQKHTFHSIWSFIKASATTAVLHTHIWCWLYIEANKRTKALTKVVNKNYGYPNSPLLPVPVKQPLI